MVDADVFWAGTFMAGWVVVFFVGTVVEWRRATRRTE